MKTIIFLSIAILIFASCNKCYDCKTYTVYKNGTQKAGMDSKFCGGRKGKKLYEASESQDYGDSQKVTTCK